MKKVGIIGNAADKFTPTTEFLAKLRIYELIEDADVMVSGGCHLGGVDIWAEEIADELGIEKEIHLPKNLRWSGGYRERNLKIARGSTEIHVIVVREYPPGYSGMRFKYCYHCHTSGHIKSGACWTAKKTEELGKPAFWHIISV